MQVTSEDTKAESTEPAVCKPEPDERNIEQMTALGFSYEASYRSLEACPDITSALDYAFAHAEDDDFNDPLPHQLAGAAEPANSKKKKRKPRQIPLELQRLFAKMQCLDCASISTEDLTTKGFQWQGMDGRVQHDAHELNR